MRKLALLYLILFLASQKSWGQNTSDVFKTDTLIKAKNYQLIGIPIIFYTPETSVGFGGGGQIFLLNKKNIYNDRVSNIFADVVFTSEGQFILDIIPQIYFGDGDFYLDVNYKRKIFPNSFWGIGADTPNSNEEPYDMSSHILRASLLMRLPPSLNFGFDYIYEHHDVTEVEEGGLLASGDIMGSDGATISGLGITFNLDTRDNIGSPFSGELLKMGAQFSSELFGSTATYNKFIADLRTYRPLGKKSIMAIQLYYEGHSGDPPFQGLSSYGGGNYSRGYFQGRYIDKHMYIIQSEYRYRFHSRWALNAFGLFGTVANVPGDLFIFDNIKPSLGGGVRFKLIKDQDTWVRADFAKGIDGSKGFYFGVNEAF